MSQQTYVFTAELMGYQGVRRTILVRDDLTLVDLHYALQSAFGWDDDQLYSFWLHGTFWGAEDQHYTHPYHAASSEPRGRSAVARLDELALTEGQRIAYLFDFSREQRVTLELREIRAGGGPTLARCIERVGVAPPRPEDLFAPEPAQDSGQETIEFVALMSEEGDPA